MEPLRGVDYSRIKLPPKNELKKRFFENLITRKGCTLLHHAILEKRQSVVRFLIKKGADLEARDYYGRTPFHLAALLCHRTIMRILLERDVDINTQDLSGRTPLISAVIEEEDAVVRFLLRRPSEKFIRDIRGKSALDYAILKKQLTFVEMLMQDRLYLLDSTQFLQVIQQCFDSGWNENMMIAATKKAVKSGTDIDASWESFGTLLHFAVTQGYRDLASFLLKKGASTEVKCSGGETPLFCALRKPLRLDILRLLLEKGADFNVKNRFGYTAHDWALSFSRSKKIAKEDGRDFLQAALILEEYGAKTLKVSQIKIDKNLPDNPLPRPLVKRDRLQTACLQGNLPLVEYLLSLGVNISRGYANEETPLFCALQESHYTVVKRLLDNGANLYGQSNTGEQLIFHFIDRNSEMKTRQVVAFFLSHGADMNARGQNPVTGKNDMSLIHLAVHYRFPILLHTLLKEGISIDLQDSFGETALFYAFKNRDYGMLKILIENGAAANVKNFKGWTVYDDAKILLSDMADPEDKKFAAKVIKLLKINRLG